MERENLKSRLGFIFVSAACAIGLGNIWRFPYIVGQNGGACFIILYLVCLAQLGYPIMVMEFSMGRASRKGLVGAYESLKNPDSKIPWKFFGWIFSCAPVVLMMFYTVVTAWLLCYTVKFADGSMMQYVGEDLEAQSGSIEKLFGSVVSDTPMVLVYTAIVIAVSVGVCAIGLQKGVERVIKFLMTALFLLILVLVGVAFTLSGLKEALLFYLKPDFTAFMSRGFFNVFFDAMGQAFFTLSIGIGSMEIFGSYLSKKNRISGDSILIIVLDTIVAFAAGLIIFPICFTYGVNPGQGPGLIFVSMPNIFLQIPFGRWLGFLFFAFITIAALTTVIAVMEAIMAVMIDEWKKPRWFAALVTVGLVFILSMPCVFGFGPWSSFQPLGKGSCVLDLEDFIISNTLLPLGAFCLIVFCMSKFGWGQKNFFKEANTGVGIQFPEDRMMAFYYTWIMPLFILFVLVIGYYNVFSKIFHS